MAEIPTLIIREPGSGDRKSRLEPGFVSIGRGESSDIVLRDRHVSRTHLRLEVQPDQVTFQNLSEVNAVMLNGQPRQAGRILVGDVLEIGRTELTLSRDEATSSPAAQTAAPAGNGELSEIEKVRLHLLEEIVEVLPGPGDRQRYFEQLLEALARIMDVRRAFVALRVGQGGPAQQVASLNREAGGGPVKMSRTIVRRVMGSGEGLLASDAMADPELGLAESVVDLGIKSVICVPIHRGSEVVGVLYGDNRARTKSFGSEDLRFMSLLARILSVQLDNQEMAAELKEENLRLRRIIDDEENMIATSPEMRDLLESARKAAATDATIMITGETGVGKTLLARTIHRLSKRADRPFVEVSCAAIPETLLEAEMFGYGPQSGISGANPSGREGYFEEAGDGTLFLDEIGDLSRPLQAKILHALEGGQIRRLGSNRGHEVRCRIISATNQDLKEAVAAGEFRRDLYFRLRVIPLHVPPLRDRPEAVLPLTDFLLRKLAPDRRTRVSNDARSILLGHNWPGNVRELRNALSRALALGDGATLDTDLLRDCLGSPAVGPRLPVPTLEEVQQRHIHQVLRLFGGNKKKAAEALQISRSTLYSRLGKHDGD